MLRCGFADRLGGVARNRICGSGRRWCRSRMVAVWLILRLGTAARRLSCGCAKAAGGSPSGGQGRRDEPERGVAFVVWGEVEPVAEDAGMREKRCNAGMFVGLAAGRLTCEILCQFMLIIPPAGCVCAPTRCLLYWMRVAWGPRASPSAPGCFCCDLRPGYSFVPCRSRP